MKKLLILPAFFLLGSLESFAAPPACVTSGGILSIITIDDVEYKTTCCSGLEVENIGSDEVCFKKDDSPVDPTLQSCSTNTDCSGGMGCFVQDPDDLFSSSTDSDAEDTSQTEARLAMDDKIENVLGEDGEEKPNGQGCTYHAECGSYNCAPKKTGNRYIKSCEEKRICRLAKENEVAVSPVNCEEELYKDQSNVCKNKTDGVYLGLLGDVQVQTEVGNECKMDLPEDAKYAGQAAMKALRGMEWVFASQSTGDHEDCLRMINPVTRDKIGKVLFEKRKVLVRDFNLTWAQIKKDYQTIMAAQEADAAALSQAVQLHGESITQEMIKSRTATGFDMLIMMKRRNLLFMDYEEKMQKAVTDAFNEVIALEGGMAGFGQNSKSWTVKWNGGEKGYSKGDVSCRPTIFRNARRKVKDRWGNNYKVFGRAAGNGTMQNNELFINSLAAMAGGSKSAAINDLTRGTYYLLDPLTPANKNFESYGSRYGFLRGGNRYRKLNGSGNGSLQAIRNDFPASLIQYLKTMNPENTANYLYEPELVQITDGEVTKKEENNCLGSVRDLAKPECANINKYVQDISDVSMAQYWAFSRTSGRNYKNYFHNTDSWRRRLFSYYSTNYANLKKYYGVLLQYRTKQNNCIDQRLGLVSSTILGGGYVAGLTNNYWDPSKYNEQLNSSNPQTGNQIKSNLSVNHNFSGFNGATNSVKNGGALKDNMATGGTSSSSASVSSTSDASFAANLSRMNDANKKNMSASDFSSKSKDVMDSMKTVAGSKSNGAGSSSSASLGSGSGNNSSAFGNGLGGGANAATLGNDLKGDADKDAGDKKSAGAGVASGAGAGAANAGAGAGFGSGLSGIVGGSSSGVGSADASGAGYQDPTGMSDEEKDRLMANYERTKSQYNPNDDDSLFKVVSKAYVRNLEKVLTKKKKTIEPVK